MHENNNLELRSEKMRNIIGKIPPFLLRKGIAIITIVIITLLCLMYFIPYPQNKNLDIIIENRDLTSYIATGILPISEAKGIMIGQKVYITTFSLNKNYSFEGYIQNIIELAGKVYIEIEICISDYTANLATLPYGEAIIQTSNASILKRILYK